MESISRARSHQPAPVLAKVRETAVLESAPLGFVFENGTETDRLPGDWCDTIRKSGPTSHVPPSIGPGFPEDSMWPPSLGPDPEEDDEPRSERAEYPPSIGPGVPEDPWWPPSLGPSAPEREKDHESREERDLPSIGPGCPDDEWRMPF